VRSLIDPGFIALHGPVTRDYLEDHVESVVSWAAAIRAGDLKNFIPPRLLERLATLELYPLRQTYDKLLKEARISAYSGSDIATLIHEIIDRSESIDDLVVDFEGDSFEIDPASELGLPCNCHPDLDDLTVAAWTACAALSLRANLPHANFFLTQRTSASGSLSGRYEFERILYFDDIEIEDAAGEYRLPLGFELREAAKAFGPATLLRDALVEKRNLTFALQIGGEDAHPDEEWKERSIDLAPTFISDLKTPDILNNESLLRRVIKAISEISLNVAQEKTHALRKTAKAGSAQIKDGEYSAWRHDVDHEWHVHYWRGPGGVIQFASVNVHNHFAIPKLTRSA